MRHTLQNVLKFTCSATSSKPVTLRLNELTKSAHLTLSNPKKRNPLSLETVQLLTQSFQQVEQLVSSKKVKIVTLEGEGPVFSAGHDLKQLSKSTNPREIFEPTSALMLRIRNLPVPTVCAINGVAAAAGLQLALACDIIIATEKSTFSTPGVKWGIFCSTPGVELIRAMSSEKKANEMLLFGEPISAQEAYQHGLITKVVPEDKYKAAIEDYITKINNLSGDVVSYGKKILRSQQTQGIEKAYEISGEAMVHNVSKIEDCKQGFKAFTEKRHPHFKN